MIENYLYHYRCKVISVYDGDTFKAEINLGFGLSWKGYDGKGVSIRMLGIDSSELKGDNKNLGILSRDKLRELILGKDITVKTIKDSTEKYGRYLGIVILDDGTNVNDFMVNEGYAKKIK